MIGRRDRRVRGGRDDAHEAKGREEASREVKEMREGRTARGANEEERRHDPAAPARLERDGGRDDLPEKREDGNRARRGEGVLDGGHAQPRISVADERIEGCEEDAASGGDEVWMVLEAAEAAFDPAQRLDEKQRDEAEDGSEDDRQADELGLAQAAEPLVEGRNGRLNAADEVGDDAGDEARERERRTRSGRGRAPRSRRWPRRSACRRRPRSRRRSRRSRAGAGPRRSAGGCPRRGSRSRPRSGRRGPPSRPNRRKRG